MQATLEPLLELRSFAALRRWQLERATVRQLVLLHHLTLVLCVYLRDTDDETLYAMWSSSIEERGPLGLARAALILLGE